MIRALIIDDEHLSRKALLEELIPFNNIIEIVGEFDSCQGAINGINELKPNAIFLDINLGDGNGFDVLEKVSYKEFSTVFVTAYDDYAIKAFKYSALDYLLKPIDTNEVKNVIEKLSQNNTGDSLSHVSSLIKNIVNQNEKKIPIPHGDGINFYNINEFIRFEADGNYTTVYLTDNTKLLTAKTLKDFESLLENYRFERVHHGHLINLSHIKKYVNKEGGYIIMSDKSSIPISQRKKAYILKVIENGI
jgi:two-component system LytT family response regulator